MARRIFIHLLLFCLTVLSTIWVGGPLYSAAIMTILLSHEMGHYLTSRRYGVSSTLPYFIPFPHFPFGTFGAVIRMRGSIYDKRALFDIGAAGPLVGFIFSFVCACVGIKLSAAVRMGATGGAFIELGDPLLFKALEWAIVRNLPPNYELVLHPIAYAAWVGLFVTSMNLLPIGQLDGGHIAYAVMGRKSVWLYRGLMLLLVGLAVFYSLGWLVLTALLSVFGIRHPAPVDNITPLDGGRRALAALMLFIFILSFVPAPFPGGSIIELAGRLLGR
jgi:membrane-associated protease RseP (regulator of RpoE activity)